MSDLIPSLIRTYVPLIVSFALAWLARTWGFIIDEESTAAAHTLVMGVVFAVYYTLVRVLERKLPWVGTLLGTAKAPTYDALVKVESSGALTAGPASGEPTGDFVSPGTTVGDLTPAPPR